MSHPFDDLLAGSKPRGCSCGSMMVGGVNGPSRSVRTVDPACPWHHRIHEAEKALAEERRKVKATDPAILKIVCALLEGGQVSCDSLRLMPSTSERLVEAAHAVLRAIRERKP